MEVSILRRCLQDTCFFRIALSVCECLKEIKHQLGKIGKRFLRGYKVTFKLCHWIDAEDPIEPWQAGICLPVEIKNQ